MFPVPLKTSISKLDFNTKFTFWLLLYIGCVYITEEIETAVYAYTSQTEIPIYPSHFIAV